MAYKYRIVTISSKVSRYPVYYDFIFRYQRHKINWALFYAIKITDLSKFSYSCSNHWDLRFMIEVYEDMNFLNPRKISQLTVSIKQSLAIQQIFWIWSYRLMIQYGILYKTVYSYCIKFSLFTTPSIIIRKFTILYVK